MQLITCLLLSPIKLQRKKSTSNIACLNQYLIEKTFYTFELIFQVVRHEDNLKLEGQFEGRKQTGQVTGFRFP